ncbi:MAG TPA: DUF3592 domain-containing protein [Acidobacteriaceae bacterium]|nr:DUF3592 domain-containing protein [Acidobacteriaceae bacterium]
MAKDNWLETTATVFTCGVEQHLHVGAMATRLEGNYLVTFNYTVDGKWFSGEFRSNEEYKEGQPFTISYDPLNPSINSISVEESNEKRWTILGWAIAILVSGLWIWYDLSKAHR